MVREELRMDWNPRAKTDQEVASAREGTSHQKRLACTIWARKHTNAGFRPDEHLRGVDQVYSSWIRGASE